MRSPEEEEQLRAEIASAEAALHGVDPDNHLLRPEVPRTMLWFQAVASAIRFAESPDEPDPF